VKVIQQILYYAFIVWWVIAPAIVNDVLLSRNIILPSDLATYGVLIWYATPLIQIAWINKDNPKKPKDKQDHPSYRKSV
jgi:hypothetical protein